MVWNVAGLFVNLRNITSGSNKLWFVQNMAFHLLPSLIWMLLCTPADIKFGEVLCTAELIDEVRNEW
jgi:hypothetical protein